MQIPATPAARARISGARRRYAGDADWTVSVLMDTGLAPFAGADDRSRPWSLLLVPGGPGAGAVLIQRRARLHERIEMESARRARTAGLEHRVAGSAADRVAAQRQQQNCRQTQTDLIQAGKLAALGQMSAALSHEFNQPLAAVQDLCRQRRHADRPQARTTRRSDNLPRISSLIDRMASISRHLRNFARKPNEKLGPVSRRRGAERHAGNRRSAADGRRGAS